MLTISQLSLDLNPKSPRGEGLGGWAADNGTEWEILLMIKILHYLKDPKLWELWYKLIPSAVLTAKARYSQAPASNPKLCLLRQLPPPGH